MIPRHKEFSFALDHASHGTPQHTFAILDTPQGQRDGMKAAVSIPQDVYGQERAQDRTLHCGEKHVWFQELPLSKHDQA
jgi:hypothetical protein